MRKNPGKNIRSKYLPIWMWDLAEKQAMRSTLKTFKTGAIITDGHSVISKGCSHQRDKPLPRLHCHAEEHCLSRVGRVSGLTCLVVTINKSGNYAWSSKPCQFCTNLMFNAGIERVIYAERDNSGDWSVIVEYIDDLIKRTNPGTINSKYAKQMRLVS